MVWVHQFTEAILTSTTLKGTRWSVAKLLYGTLLDGRSGTTIGSRSGPGQGFLGRHTIWQIAKLVSCTILNGTLVASETLWGHDWIRAWKTGNINRHVWQLVDGTAFHGTIGTAERRQRHDGCTTDMWLGHKVMLLCGHRIHGTIEAQTILHGANSRSTLGAIGLVRKLSVIGDIYM